MFVVMADGSSPAAARAAFEDIEYALSAADELLPPCAELLSFAAADDDGGGWNRAA